jgi:arsenate reductase (thioredoxin)
MESKKPVLIFCTGNSSRSQMGEGSAAHLAGSDFEVFSAATKPVGLNAMSPIAEIGIDITRHRSKLSRWTSSQPSSSIL